MPIKLPEFHFPPLLKKLKRGGPAMIHPKDAGTVIAYTGIGKTSRVLELGCGSGFMTAQLANIVFEVVCYDKREEFLDLAKENLKKLNLINTVFKLKDVNEGIEEKNQDFDLVFADLPEPQKIVDASLDALKKDGFLVGYCLQMEQAKILHLDCEKKFSNVFTIEVTTREYQAKEFGFRPMNFGLVYTAFLVFAQK